MRAPGELNAGPERAGLISLLLIACGCAVLVWAVNAGTTDRIRDARNAALRATLLNLAGPERVGEINEPLRWPLVLCEQRTVVQSRSRGYGGMIELLVALGPEPRGPEPRGPEAKVPAAGTTVLALQIQRHEETPGIGDFIAAPTTSDARTASEPPWLDRFLGSNRASLAARPVALDAVSGATITVRGVRRALTAALESTPPITDRRCGTEE